MLLPFFERLEATALGEAVRVSVWLFPAIESVHLLGLCLLGGALLIVDLRLMGLGLRQATIGDVARGARPWLTLAVAILVATGVPLFLSEAVKCYYNPAFWVKITTLPVALVFTFAWRQPAAEREGVHASWRSRTLGVTSLLLWLIVAAAGRWIGFSG
jgi:hypothetical protein